MIRCFLAINLSSEIRQFIKASFAKWRSVNCKVKWVQPENSHITLKFLGNVETAKLADINRGIEEVVKGFGKFELSLSSPGVFPNPKRPRILWLGLDGEIKRLAELQNKIDTFLIDFGFEPEKKGFVPHITVGRIKKAPFKVNLESFLKSSVPSYKFHIREFYLMQSTLTPKGPIYTELKSFLL